ncbi:hypothetical protein SAMD00019534_088750 [Acytostelium subglobosum LB1]|uniref:hypothetical protein n=1 Tax=Acytostelium subglobosum LB1 TaxID=1410327 RepID=UPI00064520A8|nr:hypothetical protein SAMD00019534_088750 [Acytostelium subglobosum LB1]GAM25700.1 hypothetical protein SAMD00019534_088750 [Acytostelium subglobosum LB1]|eukprot:XP_012751218.1 hypothetical protein SAMD00019534_088750 [Acytostelium subglobosum LB1]
MSTPKKPRPTMAKSKPKPKVPVTTTGKRKKNKDDKDDDDDVMDVEEDQVVSSSSSSSSSNSSDSSDSSSSSGSGSGSSGSESESESESESDSSDSGSSSSASSKDVEEEEENYEVESGEEDDEDIFYDMSSEDEAVDNGDEQYELDQSEIIQPDDQLILIEVVGEDPGILVNNQYSLIGLDTPTPLLQIGERMYRGRYQDVVGTQLFFRNPKRQHQPHRPDAAAAAANFDDLQLNIDLNNNNSTEPTTTTTTTSEDGTTNTTTTQTQETQQIDTNNIRLQYEIPRLDHLVYVNKTQKRLVFQSVQIREKNSAAMPTSVYRHSMPRTPAKSTAAAADEVMGGGVGGGVDHSINSPEKSSAG